MFHVRASVPSYVVSFSPRPSLIFWENSPFHISTVTSNETHSQRVSHSILYAVSTPCPTSVKELDILYIFNYSIVISSNATFWRRLCWLLSHNPKIMNFCTAFILLHLLALYNCIILNHMNHILYNNRIIKQLSNN